MSNSLVGTVKTYQHHVRVWFGENIVAQKVCATQAAADLYEAGMRQRHQSLRVTNDPVHYSASVR